MKFIKPLILESKQVGILYHYTNITSLIKIVETGKLIDNVYNRGYISFTRNGFNNANLGSKNQYARIIIDGNTLSNKYSIIPHSRASAFGNYAPLRDFKDYQSEERIYKKEIFILNDIICIEIIKDYANFELSKNEKIFLESKIKLKIVDDFKPFKEIVENVPLEEEEQFSNNTHMSFISRNSSAGQSGKVTTAPGSKPSQMSSSEYDRKVNAGLKSLNKKPPILKQNGKQI